jgi:hypothetical protein
MGALLVALGALGTAGFFSCFERKTIDTLTSGSSEAQRNPYLALGRLLEEMGHEVRWLEGPGSLDELPPAEATLLLTNSRRTLTARRAAPLLEWVRGGGHLITAVHSTWERAERDPDPLIDPLGLFAYRDTIDAADEDSEAEDEAPEPAIGAFEELLGAIEAFERWDLTAARLDDRRLEVDFLHSPTWAAPQDVAGWVAYGENGAHIAQVDLAGGRVTALTDDHFARNARIGERDHAELWVRLIGPASEGAPVWIVISERWLGLLSQVWKHAAPAALSAACLLAAWLWHAARRFGPIRPDALPERRRWIEHLEAVGRFHWRRDRARELVGAARNGLHKALARSHPAWARLAEAERNEQIGLLSGLPADQVEAALAPERIPAGEADVIRTIARIERIRASL